MRIRPASQEDAKKIAEIHVIGWQTTYRGIVDDETLDQLDIEKRQSFWQQIIREGISVVLVAESDIGDVIGFISGGKNPTHDTPELAVYDAQLYAIYVLQSHQKQGIGRQLLQSLVPFLIDKGYQSMFLWVLTENVKACQFYDSLGAKNVYQCSNTVGKQELSESAYAWEDIHSLILI